MGNTIRTNVSISTDGVFGVKLSRQDLNFFLRHTQYDGKDINELYKDFMKSSPSGKMTKDQFLKMYKTFFPAEKNSREYCDHVFRNFDTDNNGHISFREFLFAINLLSTGTPAEKLSLLFHMYDVNGDGVISLSELTIIVESIFKLLSASTAPLAMRFIGSASDRAKKIFEQLDQDGDNKITMSEFLSGCLKDEVLTKMLTTNTCSLVGTEV